MFLSLDPIWGVTFSLFVKTAATTTTLISLSLGPLRVPCALPLRTPPNVRTSLLRPLAYPAGTACGHGHAMASVAPAAAPTTLNLTRLRMIRLRLRRIKAQLTFPIPTPAVSFSASATVRALVLRCLPPSLSTLLLPPNGLAHPIQVVKPRPVKRIGRLVHAPKGSVLRPKLVRRTKSFEERNRTAGLPTPMCLSPPFPNEKSKGKGRLLRPKQASALMPENLLPPRRRLHDGRVVLHWWPLRLRALFLGLFPPDPNEFSKGEER